MARHQKHMEPVQVKYIPADDPICLCRHDGAHFVYDAGLAGNAYLHRFKNLSCVNYSAIYQGDREMYNCPREDEANMIKAWNRNY